MSVTSLPFKPELLLRTLRFLWIQEVSMEIDGQSLILTIIPGADFWIGAEGCVSAAGGGCVRMISMINLSF